MLIFDIRHGESVRLVKGDGRNIVQVGTLGTVKTIRQVYRPNETEGEYLVKFDRIGGYVAVKRSQIEKVSA